MSNKQNSYKLSNILINLGFILYCCVIIIPFLSIISISFANEKDIVANGYSLLPRTIDFTGYGLIFKNPMQIVNAYKTTITVSVIGTSISLFITTSFAYVLSRRDYPLRKYLNFFTYFTMIFSGGTVPSYILITKYLGLRDSLFALILPLLISAWNVFVLRTFMQKIPESIIESARIDGANEFAAFFKIIIPMAKPGIATIGILTLMQYWNDWWLALLYIDDVSRYPLQFLLYKIMNNLQTLSQNIHNIPAGVDTSNVPMESTRMAMCLIAAGPMLIVFPFFQKYFVKGLTIGSVKG